MCAAAFYRQRQQSKDSVNTTIDTRHRQEIADNVTLSIILKRNLSRFLIEIQRSDVTQKRFLAQQNKAETP
jgi:hypothetical protein